MGLDFAPRSPLNSGVISLANQNSVSAGITTGPVKAAARPGAALIDGIGRLFNLAAVV
jgi:hypothetical protein